jgi:hypothetical protein
MEAMFQPEAGVSSMRLWSVVNERAGSLVGPKSLRQTVSQSMNFCGVCRLLSINGWPHEPMNPPVFISLTIELLRISLF